MGSRRTRSDVKTTREQWKKPYKAVAEEIDDKKLDDFFDDMREKYDGV